MPVGSSVGSVARCIVGSRQWDHKAGSGIIRRAAGS